MVAVLRRKHLGDDVWAAMSVVSEGLGFRVVKVLREALVHPAKAWISTRSWEFLKFLVTEHGRCGYYARAVGSILFAAPYAQGTKGPPLDRGFPQFTCEPRRQVDTLLGDAALSSRASARSIGG